MNMKVRAALQSGPKAGFRKYIGLFYGKVSPWFAIKAELLTGLLGAMPGAAGIFLRRACYRKLLGAAGPQVLIGRNVVFRHPKKIRLGNNVVIDDNCVLDAKGDDNEGITLGDNVFLGRNTIVYCKNGDIRLEKGVNISSNCTIFSGNKVTIGEGVMIGAYTYMLSGGEYDFNDTQTPFAEQAGMKTKGELTIGRNCWLGARVTVLDAACIGEHCVIGAGAVVTKPVPADTLALGVPAKVVRQLPPFKESAPERDG